MISNDVCNADIPDEVKWISLESIFVDLEILFFILWEHSFTYDFGGQSSRPSSIAAALEDRPRPVCCQKYFA